MTIEPTPPGTPYYASTFEVTLTSVSDGVPLGKVIDARVMADRGWSPRWQATVTIAADFDHAVYGRDYLRLRIRRMAGAALPLSDWTERWGGKLSQYTALGASSLTPAKITEAIGARGAGGEDYFYAPEEMTLDLYISDVQRRLGQGETVITLHSGEVVLQDIRRMELTDLQVTGPRNVTELVEWVIARANPQGVVERIGFMGSPDPALLYGEIVWRAGDSAWDVLDYWLNANGYPLYSIAENQYRLVGFFGDNESRTYTVDVDWSTSFEINQRPSEQKRSRLRRFSYADTGQTSIDGAGQRGYVRGIVDEYTVGSRVPAASNWSPNSTGAGSWRDRDYESATVVRAAELLPRPGLTCSLRGTRPDGTRLLGVIDAITWTFPEGLEELRITNLTDGDSIGSS